MINKMNNDITCRVTGSLNILIKPISKDIDLNQPLYAINWFSTKMEWLYHFYNFVASRSVAKIGGAAFFKGKITETLIDEANTQRELLLIVKYPGGKSFKALMELAFFKVVSILRVLAVKRFTFGFTQMRMVDMTSTKDDSLEYLLHHFKSVDKGVDFAKKLGLITPVSVNVKYAGQMVANLYSQQKSEEAESILNLMDGVIIYESKSKELLSDMVKSKDYSDVMKQLESSYIGFMDRI